MQYALGQVQERMPTRPAPEGMMPVPAAATAKEIHYDYVAKFALQGRRGNRVQDVINISIEGAFVAVAIGYSFIPAPLSNREEELRHVKDAAVKESILGFPLIIPRPITADEFAASSPKSFLQAARNLLSDVCTDPRMLMECLLVRLCGIDFKYSIVDSGTGRELQNQPIHNIAGLGEATGDRPFRLLAKPMLFLPRSTIRIEIEEISEGPIYGYDEINPKGEKTGNRIGAELFIVLHGYKMLGYGTALP